DQALAELEADPKTKHPSTSWRRQFSLLLGLERLLSEEEPKLADGTELSAHQVDALSGTLAALLAEAERAGSAGNGRVAASATRLGRGGGRGGFARRAAGGSQCRQALLVRARDGRRQDGCGARLRRGLPDRWRADPHAPAQPGRPVPRRAARPRLLQAHLATP